MNIYPLIERALRFRERFLVLALSSFVIHGCGDLVKEESVNYRTTNSNSEGSSDSNADSDAGSDNIKVGSLDVVGKAFTNSPTPEWLWMTDSSDLKTELFRFSLDDEDLENNGTMSRGRSFKATEKLSEGSHTFFIQKQVGGEQWSEIKSFSTYVDFTAPHKPEFTGPLQFQIGSVAEWTWEKQSDVSSYVVKLGDSDFADGGKLVQDNLYKSDKKLSAGEYELFIVGFDMAGNQTPIASHLIRIGEGI